MYRCLSIVFIFLQMKSLKRKRLFQLFYRKKRMKVKEQDRYDLFIYDMSHQIKMSKSPNVDYFLLVSR